MLTTIQNDRLVVTADTRGAELQSIEAKGGLSYLWTGTPPYWSYRAPTLFPIIGALRDGHAWSAGGEITLPKHGFCRQAEFAIESAEDTAVTYRLTDSEATRKGYPYSFTLRIRYELEGDGVTTRYIVKNEGDQDMPFFVGGHPAFRIPLEEGETLEDYRVEFAQPETADCPMVDLTAGLILDTERNRFLTDRATFALNHVLFRGDALIFDELKSRRVRLYSAKSGHGVRMDFEGMQYLAIWSPANDSPFVCLEPWTGMATCASEDDIFEHKRGVTVLEPGAETFFAFTVTVF